MSKLFTSESVCAGHPDKICDAVSDALLDAIIQQDKYANTGIETVVGANRIALFGEVRSSAKIDYELITRETIKNLGYDNPDWNFSHQSLFNNYIHGQSPDISIGIDKKGAGDQGMMFGYACDETDELMPMPISIAHALVKKIDEVRIAKINNWLRPDGKAQVTIEYVNNRPTKVVKVVLAVAHSEAVNQSTVKKELIKTVITPVLDRYNFKLPNVKDIIINGTGKWHIPGPSSDAGLTGRKIVVDTYGGYARVGGGAFSGKDPSKVDRSGAYAARFIAKNIVANKLASKCEVGLAYVIGQPKPLMQTIETFNTATVSDKVLNEYLTSIIDTSVSCIIDRLNLLRPIYSQTSAYGHFGKSNLPWEQII